MFKSLIAASLSLSLVACGGGGTSPAPVDNSQAIKDAIPGIVASLPPAPKPFKGAFMAVEGVSVGYVEGYDKHDAVASLMTLIINNPTKYEPLYKLLLSDAGLKVVVFGESTGKSAINGALLFAPDVHFVVRLTSGGGLVILEA